MSEKKKMSVAEILAEARKVDNKGGPAAPKETGESEATPVSPAPDVDAAQPVAEADTGASDAAKSTPAAPLSIAWLPTTRSGFV